MVVEARRSQLKALTGLRSFAALAVVAFHFGTNIMPTETLARLARTGAVGVPFFFVLSGFILAYNYADLYAMRMNCTARTFWVARFARIYPIYAIGIALGIGPGLWIASEVHRTVHLGPILLVNALLLESWVPSWVGVITGPAWSLSAEVFFYALMPLILPWCLRLDPLKLASACWAVTLLIDISYLWFLPHTARWQQLMLYHPLVHLPEFLMGMAVGIHFLRRDRTNFKFGSLLSIGAAALTLVVIDALADLSPEVLFGGLLAPLFSFLICTMAWGRGPLAAVLSSRPLVLLGEASYALYLTHTSVWFLLMHLTRQPVLTQDPSLAAFLTYVGICVALSIGLYQYVEMPARQAIRNSLAVRRAGIVPTRSANVV